MKGRLIDFSIGRNQKQRITIEIDSDFRDGFDALRDAELEISIKKWRKRRSKDANAYFHLIVNAIAEARGLGNDEVKRRLVVEYGVLARDADNNILGVKLPAAANIDTVYPYTKMYKQVEEGGKLYNCYLLYKRSSDMDTAEMARLIDNAVLEAQELGIDTDTPAERARWSGLLNEKENSVYGKRT